MHVHDTPFTDRDMSQNIRKTVQNCPSQRGKIIASNDKSLLGNENRWQEVFSCQRFFANTPRTNDFKGVLPTGKSLVETRKIVGRRIPKSLVEIIGRSDQKSMSQEL